MKPVIIAALIAIASSLPLNAESADREKSIYVGEGRFVSEGRSVGSAILRQRNADISERQQDRQHYEREYERSNSYYEREYDYDPYYQYNESDRF